MSKTSEAGLTTFRATYPILRLGDVLYPLLERMREQGQEPTTYIRFFKEQGTPGLVEVPDRVLGCSIKTKHMLATAMFAHQNWVLSTLGGESIHVKAVHPTTMVHIDIQGKDFSIRMMEKGEELWSMCSDGEDLRAYPTGKKPEAATRSCETCKHSCRDWDMELYCAHPKTLLARPYGSCVGYPSPARDHCGTDLRSWERG